MRIIVIKTNTCTITYISFLPSMLFTPPQIGVCGFTSINDTKSYVWASSKARSSVSTAFNQHSFSMACWWEVIRMYDNFAVKEFMIPICWFRNMQIASQWCWIWFLYWLSGQGIILGAPWDFVSWFCVATLRL